MKKIPILTFLALLAGCGGYYSVKVPYRVPGDPAAAAARPALGALYLVVRPPNDPIAEKAGGLAGLLGKSLPDMDLPGLGALTARAVNAPGSRICAWAVEKVDSPPGIFAPRFSPSGLMVVSLKKPAITVSRRERSVVRYDKNKNKETVKTTVWVYSASLAADVRVLSWPDKAVLDSWADSESYSEERFDDSREKQDWYAAGEEKLFNKLAGKIAARYTGHMAYRFRPLFKVKKDAESEKALSLARSGSWAGAVEIWRARAERTGGWRDYLGLAVAAELSKDPGAARDYYKRAQAASSGDKAAKPVRWADIYRDIDSVVSEPQERPCDGSWFAVRTAVLPFADETTSIDGPILARQLVFDRLKAAGYDLMPLEETDELLRRHGFSDGGQLAAAAPEKIAGWLGAGRLVYCDISDYGEIMAGIYNRRMIAGTARVREKGGAEFSFRESVIKIKTQKSLIGGLASQLAKGMMERIKNKPLGYEAGLFSRQVAGDLPADAR